jgi:hypothetical protein
MNATSERTPQVAQNTPRTLPMLESSILSVSNCRAMRDRPAPKASRTAISLWRAAERASISPATFAHAISKTMHTADIKIVSVVENRSRIPTTASGAAINAIRGASPG